MHRSRILWGLVTGLALCASASFGEQEYLPDTTPKEGVPVPMTVYKIPPLETPPGADYAIGLLKDISLDHGEATIRFKALAAEGEQEAGIVVRYKDPQNFYVIVASAKDESCALYRVKAGKLKKIDSQDVIVTPFTWHKLHVIFAQENYTAFIDEQLALGVKDSGLKNPGQMGLWTKGSSRILFNDFRVSKSTSTPSP